VTTQTVNSKLMTIPAALAKRVAALGVALLRADSEGHVTPFPPARPIEQVICQSRLLGQMIRSQWAPITSHHGEAIELWPGLWLVPLPCGNRRRTSRHREPDHLTFALLMTTDLLDSEQLQGVCDAAGVDRQALVAKAEPTDFVTRAEIPRLAMTLDWLGNDAIDMSRGASEIESMSQQLAESYEELSLLYKLSSNMLVDQVPESFLTEACADLQQVVGLRWMCLLLCDDEPRLNALSGRMFTAGPIEAAESQLREIGNTLMHPGPEEPRPLVVDDTSTSDLPHVQALAKHLLVVSLTRDDQPYGVLFGGDKLDDSPISSVDSKLCSSLANSLAIFLENNMLFEDMQAMFMGTLHALTSSIDAKDSYTHGHSERVALMSRKLAEAAGLDEKTVERVYVAGLLHDVGKIGVPEHVLCKPGQLTREEFDLIKMHPEIGARILSDIRQMQDLIPGVLYHHERWDGRGYPHGLTSHQIPLFGRLIGLADSFDAMSSNRTYRRRLAHAQVITEIKRCAGTQFDPQLAAKFVELDFTEFYELIRTHQQEQEDGETRQSA